MACKMALVLSLSVLAFFICLGTAEAGPQCMYKLNPYYHSRCETNDDNDNCRSAYKKFEAPKYMGGMCHAKSFHILVHRQKTLPPLGQPLRYIHLCLGGHHHRKI
uniref:Uncharacterized protein n=1 Tax=Aegilops tauschii TaxID=37682 RepID=R7WCB6_AEGTA